MTTNPPGGDTPRRTPAAVSRHRDQSGVPNTPGPADGDVARLRALRDRLEGVLRDLATSPRDLAAVAREYRQVLAALAELAPGPGASALDEIAARRSKRGAS